MGSRYGGLGGGFKGEEVGLGGLDWKGKGGVIGGIGGIFRFCGGYGFRRVSGSREFVLSGEEWVWVIEEEPTCSNLVDSIGLALVEQQSDSASAFSISMTSVK